MKNCPLCSFQQSIVILSRRYFIYKSVKMLKQTKQMKSMESLNLNTRRSIQMQGTRSDHRQPQSNSECESKQQFSFNRQIRSNNDHSLKQKYSQIYNDLKIMSSADIIELLLEELQQNQKCKKQVFEKTHKIANLQQELTDLKQILKKKRQAIALLCETESKNLQLIEKLQNKISKKNQYGRDTHYEKKYQQLSVYMNQYIRNINMAQQEFMKAYGSIKSENSRLLKQLENLRTENLQVFKKLQISIQKLKKTEHQIVQLCQIRTKQSSNINILSQQNEILRKEIQIIQQNIRITDRLEVHISKQHHQLSSDLDFIRQKICENQNISKDIIQKLEQSSSNCDKITKDKQKFYESLQKSKDRCSGMQKQIKLLKKKNEELEQDNKLIKKQYDLIANERDQIEEDLMKQRMEKESIRRELLGLADKVRLMESTYRKQIEQSEKIKGELFKFWENKEKKQCVVREMSTKALSEVKQNGCQFSQTTISMSQKQSKLSLWHKKSEASLNIQDKENNEIHQSKDSLCD